MSLTKLKDKIFNKGKGTTATAFFYLARELGCLADLVGRNYEGEISFWKFKIKFSFRQKPITHAQLNILLNELKSHNRREANEIRKAKKK